jgi:thymidine kinase
MSYMKVVTGPMFSGKTEELLRILHRSSLAGKKILVLKPKGDTRTENEIASRRKSDLESGEFKKYGSYPAFPVDSPEEAVRLIEEYRPSVLGIDEAQFFQPWMVGVLQELLTQNADKDITIVVAGLDMDAWRKPFGIMPELFAMANEVQKETAICFTCKAPAMYSQKLGGGSSQVEVGDAEIYEARCRVCHTIPA